MTRTRHSLDPWGASKVDRRAKYSYYFYLFRTVHLDDVHVYMCIRHANVSRTRVPVLRIGIIAWSCDIVMPLSGIAASRNQYFIHMKIILIYNC
jgi:hypothetical protein